MEANERTVMSNGRCAFDSQQMIDISQQKKFDTNRQLPKYLGFTSNSRFSSRAKITTFNRFETKTTKDWVIVLLQYLDWFAD